jgi:hypothetical protein
VCGAAAAAGLTLLAVLELEGNGFTAASVVECEGWREAGLSSSWDGIFFPSSFSVLMEYGAQRYRPCVPHCNSDHIAVFDSCGQVPRCNE